MTWPLHQSERSLARYATAGATLSGDMTSSATSRKRCLSVGIDCVMRVFPAGAMAFDVTP